MQSFLQKRFLHHLKWLIHLHPWLSGCQSGQSQGDNRFHWQQKTSDLHRGLGVTILFNFKRAQYVYYRFFIFACQRPLPLRRLCQYLIQRQCQRDMSYLSPDTPLRFAIFYIFPKQLAQLTPIDYATHLASYDIQIRQHCWRIWQTLIIIFNLTNTVCQITIDQIKLSYLS